MNDGKKLIAFFLFPILMLCATESNCQTPVRLAVAGISHGHSTWILGRKDKGDLVITGIYEGDTSLWQPYARKYNLNIQLFYADLNKMLDAVKPEAVVAFGSVNQHVKVVE